ncbi:MAG: cation:proton antiporter [Pseudanabaenaceae cyanobacterium]
MQEDFRLIVDLVTVLAAATLGGLLAARLRLPTILGYIVGGVVVGPGGLALIRELIQVETLAQLGVALLLFVLGVEFSIGELQKVRRIALGGGTLQIALTVVLATAIALGAGWVDRLPEGIFLGAVLSLSSTAVVLRCLVDTGQAESVQGKVMLGILIVQDLALGLMLAVLPALDQPEAIGVAVGTALLKTGLLAGGAIAVAVWVLPPCMRLVARTESDELFLLATLVLCMGIALLTEKLGLSIEMGAFVAGLMVSEVEYADRALAAVEPLRDIFATLFFAAIGLLIDPQFLWNHWQPIAALVAVVMVGKFAIVFGLVRAFNYSPRVAIATGIGLAQIGEFSFVLASEGQKLGLVTRPVYLLVVGTTAATLMVAPFLLRGLNAGFAFLSRWPAIADWLDRADIPLDGRVETLTNHVIVCGYGRVGQNLVSLLQSKGYPVVAIERSEAKVQLLRERGIPYVYGNCANTPVLKAAGLERARSMVVTTTDTLDNRLCVQKAIALVPNLDIVARATRDGEIDVLYGLGAKEVVHPEFEGSLELSTHLLLRMGESLQAVQSEITAVRQGRYAEFRPNVACPLPSPEVLNGRPAEISETAPTAP